jgi:phage shock protein PspC (stress-responsive transcriptional regulator)
MVREAAGRHAVGMSNENIENENTESERPGGERQAGGEQPGGAERPGGEEPRGSEDLAGEQRASGEQPRVGQDPAGEQPRGEEPTAEQPRPEQPRGEEPTTEQAAPERPAAAAATAQPRRLFRSRDDRVIAGVCGGLARYLNIDPVIVRVVAVALVFAGGAGLLLYAAAFLLVPNEGEGGGPAEPPRRLFVIAGAIVLICAVLLPFRWGWGWGWGDGWDLVPLGFVALAGLVVWRFATGERHQGDARSIVRAMALGVALIILCLVLAFGAAWAAADGGDTVVAGIVIAAGLALIAGAFLEGRARWLILPALAIALPAGVVSAADLDVTGGHGERTYRPASSDAVRSAYHLGAGKLVVDLRGAKLTPGDHRLKMKLGVGEAQLLVPRNVCVSTQSHLGIGGVQVFDRDTGGVDLDWQDERRAPAGTARVLVDANVGIGAFTVHHGGDDDWYSEAGNGACA